MNITPRPPTAFQKEFQQLIHEGSSNFVGREFAFTAITNFLNHQPCGYFTIVGTPGSGKSAILAKYVMENPSVIYYSAEVEGKNLSTEFLITVCTQLIRKMGDTNVSLPDNATEGSWFFSLLLQKVSDLLQPEQRLIIAIDGCDAPKGAAKGDRIDFNNQSPDSNLFYLPRYLPERVYFLLTRRPFLSEKSGLLIETPAQILDLEAYSEQNREDVQTYIQQYISVTPSFLKNAGWITNCRDVTCNVSTSEQEFYQQLTQQLTVKSENNFMYLNHILKAISQGFYPDPFQFEPLPPGLEAYYKNHYQRIKGKGLSSVGLAVLKCLAQLVRSLSVELIAQIVDEDEYEVEKVLENWLEFLYQEIRGEEIFYSFYHTSFANWLGKQLNLV